MSEVDYNELCCGGCGDKGLFMVIIRDINTNKVTKKVGECYGCGAYTMVENLGEPTK